MRFGWENRIIGSWIFFVDEIEAGNLTIYPGMFRLPDLAGEYEQRGATYFPVRVSSMSVWMGLWLRSNFRMFRKLYRDPHTRGAATCGLIA